MDKLLKHAKKIQPNLGVLAEYRSKMEVYQERSKKVEEMGERKQNAKKVFDDLRRQRLDTFMDGFKQISLKLKEMYQVCKVYIDDYNGR
jgi:structural maintenance of chromosome 4